MPIAHDSFFGYINLFKRTNNVYSKPLWYRPPYPLLVEEPTVAETVYNLNRADFGCWSSVMFAGIIFFIHK